MKTVDRRDFMGYVCALIGCNSLPGVPLPTAISSAAFRSSIGSPSISEISKCSCGTGISSHCCISSVSSSSSGSWKE